MIKHDNYEDIEMALQNNPHIEVEYRAATNHSIRPWRKPEAVADHP